MKGKTVLAHSKGQGRLRYDRASYPVLDKGTLHADSRTYMVTAKLGKKTHGGLRTTKKKTHQANASFLKRQGDYVQGRTPKEQKNTTLTRHAKIAPEGVSQGRGETSRGKMGWGNRRTAKNKGPLRRRLTKKKAYPGHRGP